MTVASLLVAATALSTRAPAVPQRFPFLLAQSGSTISTLADFLE